MTIRCHWRVKRAPVAQTLSMSATQREVSEPQPAQRSSTDDRSDIEAMADLLRTDLTFFLPALFLPALLAARSQEESCLVNGHADAGGAAASG
ncbi:hypothetical protein A3L22_13220 [Streptomyces griseus subsp. griseus]|nr:hypothetical protein A3L22_13220 [Streptomyces griseus subsp. griseus]